MKVCILVLLASLPLKTLRITSPFGIRSHPLSGKMQNHQGTDFRARQDTVFAVLAGVVQRVSVSRSTGLSLTLDHQSVQTIYAHLSEVFVADRDSVAAGYPIGITGQTGLVTGEHLHFAVHYRNRYINPVLFLRRLIQGNEFSLVHHKL